MNTPEYIQRVDNLNTGDEGEYTPSNPTIQSSAQSRPIKDFKKVLTKTKKEGKEDLEKKKAPAKPFMDEKSETETVASKSEKDDDENAADIASMSLFDLSKKPPVKMAKEMQGGPISKVETPDEQVPTKKVESPSDLFKRMAKNPKKVVPKQPFTEETPKVAVKIDKSPEEEKFTTRYTPEQPDLSYVNPMAQMQAGQNAVPMHTEAKVERATPLTPNMKALIEQIVKGMYTVTNTDKTDTVMTLQYPPLFKDARVIVTSFETARGQFNITFENLSQAAQRLLDLEENRRTLLNALQEKGYNVQIFTTTTIMEPRLNVDQPFFAHEERDQQQQREGGGGDQPKKRNRDQG